MGRGGGGRVVWWLFLRWGEGWRTNQWERVYPRYMLKNILVIYPYTFIQQNFFKYSPGFQRSDFISYLYFTRQHFHSTSFFEQSTPIPSDKEKKICQYWFCQYQIPSYICNYSSHLSILPKTVCRRLCLLVLISCIVWVPTPTTASDKINLLTKLILWVLLLIPESFSI